MRTALIARGILFAALALAAAAPAAADIEQDSRNRMVREQLLAGNPDGRKPIKDPAVLKAMRVVPRHLFLPVGVRELAYKDYPVSIGEGQMISQPYIVALMTELADIQHGEKVLEIGTGSGYQAAVLAEITPAVYTIEIMEPPARRAEETLQYLGYETVQVRVGDGYRGWPEAAPFDAIIITAATPEMPGPLLEQLALNGKLVLPHGEQFQQLEVITKRKIGLRHEMITPVRFVPMTDEIRNQKAP